MNLFQRFWQKRRLPCAAVIVAAGAGERMQGKDKIMSKVGGKPVIAHTIAAFEASRAIDEIIVVARREQVETVRALIREYGFGKVKDVVPGGKTVSWRSRQSMKKTSRSLCTRASQHSKCPPSS